MGKKRLAEDYRRTAEENGWVAGAHEEEDSIEQTEDEHGDRYILNQQEALDQWTIFLSIRGIPTSECLQKNCPPPSNALLKDFARWYCKSRAGQLAESPNLTSVTNTLKKFFAGFQRVTGTEISKRLRKDVYHCARTTLVKQGYTTTERREKRNFDVDDLVNVLDSLWTEDDSVFIHEVMRDQITFLLLAYCFSGARIGAFLHNGKAEVKGTDGKVDRLMFKGLTWKDVHVYLFPLPDGSTEVIVKLVQRWIKNNKDPENSVLEIPTYEHGQLKFDITAFLLALAFRDNVFIGISSPADLWDFRVPEGEPFLELRIDSLKLELPVLRTVTRHGGLSDVMLDDSTFRYYFQRVVLNAGYYGLLTIHALRRAVANEVDKRATPGERNKVLGHASSDVGDRDYLSNITSVDVQGAFLREEPRTDHIAKLRSVSTKRAPGLPQALPAKEIDNILHDPTAIKLYQDLCQLRERGATDDNINEAQRKYRTYLHWLKTRALARWKEKWLEARYANIIQTRGRISLDRSSAIDRAQALFRIMPERARLAEMIKSNEPRTRAQRLSAVQDLLSLCTRNYEVMYRPGENPVDGGCPVCRCKLPEVKRNRSDHIHACRRKEFATRVGGRQSAGAGSVPVQYCFLCFKWLDGGDAWEEHCRSHLISATPKWCAVRVYCNTMISPGFCPFCLGEDGPAAKRLRQWTRNCTLMAHVEAHVGQIRSWPACLWGTEFGDVNSLRHHLSDERGLWKAEWRKFGGKRAHDEEGKEQEDDVDRVSTPNPESPGEKTRPCKRRKGVKPVDKFIEWSPSPKAQSPDPHSPRQRRADRTKASNSTKVSATGGPTRTTFISRFPTATAGSSGLRKGQHRCLDPGEPAMATQSSSNHYPDPDWDSPGVTAVGEEEGGPNSPGLWELPLQSGDRSDGVLTGHSMDDALWLERVSWTGDSTTDPASVSTPVTDTAADVFEDVLDPALSSSEPPTSQSSFPPSSLDINMDQSDFEDGLGLPSLESLLHRNPNRLSPTPDASAGHEKSTKSILQIQGWVEVEGPNGTLVLEELPDHGPEIRASPTGQTRQGQLLVKDAPPSQPVRVTNQSLVATGSCLVPLKYPSRGAQVHQTPKTRSKRPQPTKKRSKRLQPSKKGTKRSNTREQAELCRARELKDAKMEWIRCGYPRISWRGLNARLKEFSAALYAILNGTSSSVYRTELESAVVARKEQPKYVGMDNATAGYYGPRGQTIMMQHIMTEFGDELRRRAVTDRLMRATGVGSYVVTVLVPELAVMLVMEDMKVCDESARQILQKSTLLGETLHEDQ